MITIMTMVTIIRMLMGQTPAIKGDLAPPDPEDVVEQQE